MHLVPIDALDEATLQSVVANGEAEGRHLDFKQTLPGNSDGDKREFLADVTSFANAGGGTLAFGIAEALDASGNGTGAAGSIPGVSVSNQDQEQLRLEQIILSGAAPRIPGLRYKWIAQSGGNPVLVLRIAPSWTSPHMVSFKGSSRFYARNGKGKYQLDVQEIRSAFLLSQGVRTRIADFRRDRIAKIVARETPVALAGERALYVLHLIPLGAFTDGSPNHFADAASSTGTGWRPLSGSGWNDRWNLDGILYYSGPTDGTQCQSYTQVFRHGAVEAVCGIGAGPERPLPSSGLEHLVAESVQGYALRLREAGNESPLVVQVSLIGVGGRQIGGARYSDFDAEHAFDRDPVCVPDEILDPETPALAPLRRIVDTLWQASGRAGSPFVTPDGTWTPGGESNRRPML